MIEASEGNGYRLTGGQRFAPPDGVTARRLVNWPATVDDPSPAGVPGDLLLGGVDAAGTWWYDMAAADEGGCWSIFGGSFDSGDTIIFSSGLRVKKAADFTIRGAHDVSDPFPGHEYDLVCLNERGEAIYFQLFRPL